MRVRTNNHTSPNYNKINLQTEVDREMHRLPSESPVDGKTQHVNSPTKLAIIRILFLSIGTTQRSLNKYNEDV